MRLAVIGLALVASVAAQAADKPGGGKLTVRELVAGLFAKPHEVVDFSNRDLSTLDLSTIDLRRARLSGANLFGADLSSADLRGTDLVGSNLDRANVLRADFRGAHLDNARLLSPGTHEDLETASADAPRFSGASMRNARIFAEFYRTNFSDADLRGADMRPYSTGLGHTSFVNCDLSRANLSGAKLMEVDFKDSILAGANLRDADLTGANLWNADLSGADLTGAVVTGVNFDTTRIDGAKGIAPRR